MRRTVQIRVVYPLGDNAMVLRTDQDWNRSINPVSRDGDTAIFEVQTNQPYFYFKPCVWDGRLSWAVGSNYLAENDRTIYPHFFSGTRGRLTEPVAVPCGDSAYRVRAYLPPGYDENTLKRYPVLYMHDGSNLFFPAEAFMGTAWEVDDTLDLMQGMSLVDKAIVIGVEPCDRVRDYTKPGYTDYGRMLTEILVPAINRNFRTLTGPENTSVMGSSLGGVVSFYLAWSHSDVFGAAACLSSTFGYQDDLMERVQTETLPKVRIYLDSGWPRDNYEVTRSMRTLLIRRGFVWGQDLMYWAFPLARHSEADWASRCHIPFQYFLGRPRLP